MRAVPVPFLADGAYDVDAMLAARPRVLYLCAPNNPTGHVPGGDVERLLNADTGLVILDEAYAEFTGRPLLRAAPDRPRLLVTRTLSKAWGLAGLRVGYGVGGAPLIERIARVRGPYRIGRLAERAATAALREDAGWMRAHVARAVEARTALTASLAAAGFRPLPAEANFVLVPVVRAAAVARRMLARGVRVRAFTSLPGIGDAVRITVGPAGEMDAALRALVASAARRGAVATPDGRTALEERV
jgi:histidinol-phosphate aminotransferase